MVFLVKLYKIKEKWRIIIGTYIGYTFKSLSLFFTKRKENYTNYEVSCVSNVLQISYNINTILDLKIKCF